MHTFFFESARSFSMLETISHQGMYDFTLHLSSPTSNSKTTPNFKTSHFTNSNPAEDNFDEKNELLSYFFLYK